MPVQQTIALTAISQHFGGLHWWMRCPDTGELVRLLYLPPECEHFASRKALRLAYCVGRLSRIDRPFEKLFRVRRKLGSEASWERRRRGLRACGGKPMLTIVSAWNTMTLPVWSGSRPDQTSLERDPFDQNLATGAIPCWPRQRTGPIRDAGYKSFFCSRSPEATASERRAQAS